MDTGPSQFNDHNGWPTAQGHANDFSHQAVLGDTYQFNPTTVLDVHLNYLRNTNPNLPESTNVNESQFGSAYGALAPQMSLHALPSYGLSGPDNLYTFASVPSYQALWYNNYGISANLIRIIGPHSLKF